ncbi:restriction endonuclease subunit S [Serratia marcescens]|uniref:restriction endonuclease subunit S n=1 Tax=Serratia marcescens TaxID=615 RepID=UPI00331DFAE4
MSSNYRDQWASVGGYFPSHWHFLKLEELLENAKGIAVGVMYPGDHTAKGIPLIKVGDVKDGYIASQPSFFISPEVDEEYKRTRLHGTELLITLVGNPGDCVVVEPHMAGWNAARALAVVRLKDISLREWLRYILLSKPAKHLIDARLNTTVQKTLNLKDIRELGIPIPPKHERDTIIKNVSSIERKKIVSSDINQTLEKMAQALFKSWFVDFEPVKAKAAVLEAGGSQEDAMLAAMTAISGKDADALAVFEREHPEQYTELKSTADLFPSAMQDSELISIPDGWERGHVVDVTEKIFSGGTPTTTKPEYWGGDNNWFSSGETRNAFIINTEKRITSLGIKQSSTKKSILGDVLIASAGQGHTRGQTSLNMIDTYINQSVVAVRPKNKKMIAWLFLNLRSRYDEMRAISDSHSSRGSLTTKLISGMPIIIPDDRILKKFENSTFPLFNFIGHKLSEIESLAKLRDTLLPKLLSGEITLPEVEQAIGEVENV